MCVSMFHSIRTNFPPPPSAVLVKSLGFLPPRQSLSDMSLLSPPFPNFQVPFAAVVMQDKELALAVALDFQLS